jgi:predicted dehydrogenase
MAKTRKASRWRAVLVGCGQMSRVWLEAARETPGLELVGFVDIFPGAAEKAAAEFHRPGAAIGTDLDAVLKSTAANILFVCTVPEAHRGNILSGLRHGCHVLTEKPLTATMAEARSLLGAAKKARQVIAVTQNYRYRRAVRSLKRFLESGKIGCITGLDAEFYIGAHFGGFRDQMKHVLLLDMSIHHFDLARFLAGGQPRAVTAHEWNPSNSWYRHGASASASFEFDRSVVFNYRGSWCSQGFDTPWDGAWRIWGEKGAVRWDGADKIEAEVVKKENGFVWPKATVRVPLLPARTFSAPHAALMREFIHCLDSGRAPETAIADNIQSLAMIHGAIASARKGRRVVL